MDLVEVFLSLSGQGESIISLSSGLSPGSQLLPRRVARYAFASVKLADTQGTFTGCSWDFRGNGHDDVDRMGEAETSPCFLSRGRFRGLLQFPFGLLFLFLYLLFLNLVLIFLAFVSHCVSPFLVVANLLAARVPSRLCRRAGLIVGRPVVVSNPCLGEKKGVLERKTGTREVYSAQLEPNRIGDFLLCFTLAPEAVIYALAASNSRRKRSEAYDYPPTL